MGIADTDEWDSVVRSVYGLQPDFYASSNLEIKFFKGSSLFFGSYLSTAPYLTDGGVRIVAPASEQDISNIHAVRERKKLDYALVRTRENVFEAWEDRVRIDRSQYSFSLDLRGGPDFIWKNIIRPKTRNQVRKGLNSDLVMKFGGRELGRDFYQVISRAWRDLGTPTHKNAFFDSIVSAFGDRAKYLVLCFRDQPVSAALILIIDKTIYHPYACTLKAFNPLSVNNALYWRIIEYGCEQGCEAFDMGRSLQDSGTYRYKLSWGATPVPLYYAYFMAGNREPPDIDNALTSAMVGAWRHLPLPAANLLGPGVIKSVL